MFTVELDRADDEVLEAVLTAGAKAVELVDGRGLMALFETPDEASLQALLRADPRLASASLRTAVLGDQGSTWVDPLPDLRVAEQRLHLVPSASFGSGRHPTTALVLAELIARRAVYQGRPVLDVGAGSGVLGLAALLLGASEAHLVDSDPEALEVARQNAEKNGLAEVVELWLSLEEAAALRYPLVLANIVDATLMELAPALVRTLEPGGVLVLSGVRASLADEVQKTYRRLGLVELMRTEDGPWVALSLSTSW
ncbi:MAG: 50S ribosomal protein L11 methyltransferase [Myxococcota bacterium]